MKINPKKIVLLHSLLFIFLSCSDDEKPEPVVYDPVFESFSPTEAKVGTEIIISGTELGTNVSKNKVTLGDMEIKISMASAKNIWFTIPEDALTNKITVEAYGKKMTSSIDLVVLTSIELDEKVLNLQVSENYTLVPSVFGYDGKTTVSWSSDNESIAAVDQQGNVTAVSDGTAVITATVVEDPTATFDCKVNVTSEE